MRMCFLRVPADRICPPGIPRDMQTDVWVGIENMDLVVVYLAESEPEPDEKDKLIDELCAENEDLKDTNNELMTEKTEQAQQIKTLTEKNASYKTALTAVNTISGESIA